MIEIKDLVFCRGQQVVLDGISMTIQPREIVSVMGPSGCGKTTLLKCLSGLERPTSGSIVVDFEDDGEPPMVITDMDEFDLNRYRRRMGMVFQYAALFDSMTVHDNVAFPILRFRPEVDEAEVTAEVHRLLASVGLNPEQDAPKMPAELSGGMRKRVGLARALALEPKMVLYDEPSSGLDPVSAAHIDHLIVRMREQVGVTSVVVSHHVTNVLNTSDRVAMLYRGQVLFMGTPAEIQQCQDARVRQFISGSAEGPLTDVDD